MNPRFITFEGIDGAGKSSHIESLATWIRAKGQTVLVTREPGGTPLAERLREHFLHQEMDALTECLLVFAARRDHLQQRIEPALAAGPSVISFRLDRAQQVRVDLYDVTGRFVQRVVNDQMMPAGVHTMTWDGHTANGKRAATGVYFYRVVKASGTETRKLLLMR